MLACKSVVLSLLVGMSLFSCGGDEPESELEPRVIKFSGPPIESNQEITVTDIAGVWTIEATILGLEDEHWATDEYNLVISEDGRFMDFDYKDDSLAGMHGEAKNCYTLRNDGNISKLVDGGFAVDFGLGKQIGVRIYVNYDISNGQLLAPEDYFSSDSELTSAQRAQVSIEDMETMFCES